MKRNSGILVAAAIGTLAVGLVCLRPVAPVELGLAKAQPTSFQAPAREIEHRQNPDRKERSLLAGDLAGEDLPGNSEPRSTPGKLVVGNARGARAFSEDGGPSKPAPGFDREFSVATPAQGAAQAPIVFVDRGARAAENSKVPLPAALAPLDPELNLNDEQKAKLEEIAEDFVGKIDGNETRQASEQEYRKIYAVSMTDADIWFRSMFGKMAWLRQNRQAAIEAGNP